MTDVRFLEGDEGSQYVLLSVNEALDLMLESDAGKRLRKDIARWAGGLKERAGHSADEMEATCIGMIFRIRA